MSFLDEIKKNKFIGVHDVITMSKGRYFKFITVGIWNQVKDVHVKAKINMLINFLQ